MSNSHIQMSNSLWRLSLFTLVPASQTRKLVFVPLALGTCQVLMACLWVVGKPHCAVVAMFPVILLPMMGVGGKKYALDNQYFNHATWIVWLNGRITQTGHRLATMDALFI